MTAADFRLAALAALLSPSSAGALLGRLRAPGSAEAEALAQRLATAPRAERLAALAEALAQNQAATKLRGILSAERPSVARALRRQLPAEIRPPCSGPEPAGSPHPLLARICAERVAAALGA
jgi:hypothetical protein